MGKNWWKVVLLASVAGILVLFALGLNHDPHWIPSPLVDRPAPDFTAPALDDGTPITLSGFKGKWVIVNFWGSWCVSCVSEHPYLLQLAHEIKQFPEIVMIGVDFKDNADSGRRFLARHGNTGYRHALDPDQKIAIDWGVYGAPETYLVDPQGIVRYKQTGPLHERWLEQVILPRVRPGAKRS